EQCLRIVAQDTPAPLGDELQYCIRRLDLGVDLPDALKDLPDRTGLVAVNILTTTLSVHQQTGGDLVCVLERLAQTIRDRLLYLGRLRTATIGSRATATLMLLLPIGIVAFFVFRDPNYLTELLATPWGKRLTLTAIALQLIGSAWIWRIFRNSQRA
ncbi:MAG TPA: pilus assembly protein TadB, partial [Planctomycetaceae bacterium]|nr:pilus assembly protein TadB [Planctomycetaceae bacterium]